MSLIRLYPVVLALLIASCGRPAAITQSQTETQPTTAFDGSYQSTIRITHEAATVEGYSWCQTPGQPIITVTNGQFIYVMPHPDLPGNHPPTAFPATFRPDGSSVGQSVQGTISGQVRGIHIEGSIDGVGCFYAFAGDKR
jgi:hypothetical protein